MIPLGTGEGRYNNMSVLLKMTILQTKESYDKNTSKKKNLDLFALSTLTKKQTFFWTLYVTETKNTGHHGHNQRFNITTILNDPLFSHFPLLGADVQNCGGRRGKNDIARC